MIEVTFTTPDAVHALKYPTDPTELTWAQWLESKQILHAPKVEGLDQDAEATAYLMRLCAFLDVFNPEIKISELPVFVDPYTGIESLSKIVDTIYTSLDTSTPQLPDPDKYRVEYKGDWYTISGRDLDKATDNGKWQGSVAELFAWNEFQRQLMKAIETPPKGADGLPLDGATLEFAYNRMQMAAVLRKVGEPLPSDWVEQNQFIKSRAEHFIDLPMSVVRDVAAFFLITTLQLRKTLDTIGSSTTPTRIQYNPKTKKMHKLKAVR